MELDYYKPNCMICGTYIEKLKKSITKYWIYMFLVDLDWSLNKVSSWILATFPLLRLKEAYSHVCCELQR